MDVWMLVDEISQTDIIIGKFEFQNLEARILWTTSLNLCPKGRVITNEWEGRTRGDNL